MSGSQQPIVFRAQEEGLVALRKHYLDQPHEVSIETLSKCNAACTFCPYPTLDRIGTKMADGLLYSLVDQMKEWKPFFFTPFKVNEPLLDVRLYDLLCYVNEHVPQARIRIFTNGSALTLKKAEELHQIDNLELFVSLNTHRKEEYGPLMGLDYDRVIRNLDALHETDFVHPVSVLRVGWDVEFRDFVRARWPDFRPVLVKRDAWLGFTNPDRTDVPETPCSRWFELSILSDGRVSLCCMDSGNHIIGDLNHQTLLEVYNSPLWRERRERMMNRHDVPICNQCTY